MNNYDDLSPTVIRSGLKGTEGPLGTQTHTQPCVHLPSSGGPTPSPYPFPSLCSDLSQASWSL